MAETAGFSPDDEIVIQQKLQVFRQFAEQHEQLHPGNGFSIDPGPDPLAKEAVLRLMEESLERALEQSAGQALDPADRQRMQQELREEVSRFQGRPFQEPDASQDPKSS